MNALLYPSRISAYILSHEKAHKNVTVQSVASSIELPWKRIDLAAAF